MKQVLKKWFEQYFSNEEAVLLSIMLIVSFLVLATLGSILGPFIAAVIIAFLLQGLVNNLQKIGMPKLTSVSNYLFILFVCFYINTSDYYPYYW